MLVYLFQRRRNADLVLTTDVTRSEPPCPPNSRWTFVKALDIKNLSAPGGHRRF